MKSLHPWLAVAIVALVAFVLIHLCLRACGFERLFHEQIPVHTPGRSLVVLAVIAPFALVLAASLLTSAIGKASTAALYAGSWLVYASLLSQALLSMSGAYLLIFPLVLPTEAATRWLYPERWYLPLHHSGAHEPVVVGLVSVGFALIAVGLIAVLRAGRRSHLATHGLYATLRHPQHLGIIVWTLGFALWGASPVDLILWFIVSYVLVCVGIHEEGSLLERFGDEYRDYRRRVMFMPPFLPVRGPVLAHGSGREVGVMALVLALGVSGITVLFRLVAMPA